MISLKPQMNTDKHRSSLPEFAQQILRQSRKTLWIPLGFSSKIREMTMLGLFLVCFAFPAFAAEKESVFDRVMRTGTIRCGYFPYAPTLIIDPNTKEMSGIFYEIIEEMGRRLSLKVEWAEEVDYGVIAEGFKTNRYDMFCNTVWPTPERVRESSFSIPVFYSTVDIFVRTDDHRFDEDFSKLNDPSIMLAI
ncbi:MAG TPA: ABC transporter substrate-binding protein, partial [Alphaproteobacteria bacterium]|nr:ABC transporter substrate-binding protein [Alphaproteobacteria bacterium]